MIIQAIGNGNVVTVMSANQAMALMLYLSLDLSEGIDIVSGCLHDRGVCVSPENVGDHLKAIRVALDDRELDIYPHLLEADELDVEVELEDETEPKKPVIVH